MRRYVWLLLLSVPSLAGVGRVTVSLDGEWQIEDSVDAGAIPKSWGHQVPVPGLANLAEPRFKDVDQYLTIDNIYDQVAFGLHPRGAPLPKPGPRQSRNWFWYRKSFRVPEQKQSATLRINKAQFSTAVWLNGTKVGEHLGCYTAAVFDVSKSLNWTGDNELIVRVGAHPGVMPEDVPSGTDFEKSKWTPGIYDSVSVSLSDNPVIETIQVAPRISPPGILVETFVRNSSGQPVSAQLSFRVKPWRRGDTLAQAQSSSIRLLPGETKSIRQTIEIPGAKLWSPEDPFLYVLEASTAGDSISTRFGIREFRFDTATRRAYLNGRPYFLRGSNITLHRFLEDPDAGRLPWDEKWLRRLLVDIPKSMEWNTFRFCIGPVPDRWLEIADENGLLIQNEYFVWTGGKNWPIFKRHRWNASELVTQYSEWLRDNWNHPSVVIWDANNETDDEIFADKVIPAVRGLDLSNRPWENSYGIASGPDDPVEDHPYLFSRGTMGPGKIFDMPELEQMAGKPSAGGNKPTGHALILNEYGWLWLLRDGTPCVVSKKVYDTLLGPQATPAERIELNNYYLGGLTEYWRAWRNYAGVLHFVYLTFCYPNAYTCDNFKDVRKLELHPEFTKYVREAFKPLGVYVNFWRPVLPPNKGQTFDVMMVNDHPTHVAGTLELYFEDAGGRRVSRTERPFSINSNGQQTQEFTIETPAEPGKYVLHAIAHPRTGAKGEPTVSRRKIDIRKTE